MRVRYDYNADGYLSQVHNDDAGNALIWQLNDATLDLPTMPALWKSSNVRNSRATAVRLCISRTSSRRAIQE